MHDVAPRQIEFTHRQSAHCESGVAANLLTHNGLEVSEAMAFGIGGGIFFGYLPFIRLNGLPLITYRAAAGRILKKIASISGVSMRTIKFSNKQKAMAELDAVLAEGVPVGLQTGVFWLPYFPRALRFHFNAHNLVVYGKEDDAYLISDPVFPMVVRCPAADLERARFASGALAPKGKMYFIEKVPSQLDFEPYIRSSIQSVCKMMLASPFPLIGIKGIHFLARRLEKWPDRLGNENAALHLGQVVRMQEEIGTGGGGFRFMYGAFLQESAHLMGEPLLDDCAKTLTQAGDAWRAFAVMAARICKERPQKGDSYEAMTSQMHQCGKLEEEVFQNLQEIVRQ